MRKPYCLLAKKAKQKQARRRRLTIRRLKMGKLTPISDDEPVDIVADLMSVNLTSSDLRASQMPESGGDAAEVPLSDGSLDCSSYGIASVIGRRRAMEDAVAVEMGVGGQDFAYFAVFDGHGGSAVANTCRNKLHKLLTYEIEGSCLGFDWGEIMKECFKKMDEEVNECLFAGNDQARMIGSTAVVVVVGKEEIVVANCGDSRAIICRGGVPVALSHDHKLDRPDERARVEAAGGRIIDSNENRDLGDLATSRSFGHEFLKPYVISEPEVTVSKRTTTDNFLIIASDGLWDVITNEVACDMVKLCLTGKIRNNNLMQEGTAISVDAAAILAELAMAKGSKDNISVIVVELERNRACSIPLDESRCDS